MYGHESLLESKNKFFNHQLDEIKLDFKKNLKSKLESYIVQPLTRENLQHIQYAVNGFLLRNDLNIKIYVEYTHDAIIFSSNTLIDYIVWDSIQS